LSYPSTLNLRVSIFTLTNALLSDFPVPVTSELLSQLTLGTLSIATESGRCSCLVRLYSLFSL
jgi:hypothetical protein